MVKFLIIRFSSIGDIVLTTPVIRCLKNQIEDAEIHYLTKKQFYSVIQANPSIHKIHQLDNNFNDLIKVLKEENFDFIIDLHHNLRSFRIKSKLGVVAFSFYKLNIKKWLLVNFKINKLPDIHIVDRYLKTLEVFDVTNDNKGLDYFIPAGEEVNMKNVFPESKTGYIAVVIGTKHFTKQVPDDMLTDLCNRINVPLIFLGGKEDFQKAENIVKGCKGTIINGCGKYTLNQSASVIKQASVVITPDTGLMHIASAFKRKIISIWGNTIPGFGMYPYLPDGNSKIFEVKGLSCRPCSKIGFEKCPKKHFKCMRNQDIEGMYNTISGYLKR